MISKRGGAISAIAGIDGALLLCFGAASIHSSLRIQVHPCPSSTASPTFADEIAAWRRDFHENPELLYDVHRTAGIVAEKLKEFGCDEVVTGIGRTGVVGVIKGQRAGSGKVIGLRADMDALPIEEATERRLQIEGPGQDARLRP